MSVFLIGGNYVIVLLGRTEKRKLIYQKISAPVFAARGIERKFQPCFFRSLSDISFVIYSMQKINHDKKASRIL